MIDDKYLSPWLPRSATLLLSWQPQGVMSWELNQRGLCKHLNRKAHSITDARLVCRTPFPHMMGDLPADMFATYADTYSYRVR